MGEIIEMYQALKEDQKIEKEERLSRNIMILKMAGVNYRLVNEYHLRIGKWNFYPSTGKFNNGFTRDSERGLGIIEFLKIIKHERTRI